MTGDGRKEILQGAGNRLFTYLGAGPRTAPMGKIHLIVNL